MQNMILGCECAASRCTRSHKLQTRKQESINHEKTSNIARQKQQQKEASSFSLKLSGKSRAFYY